MLIYYLHTILFCLALEFYCFRILLKYSNTVLYLVLLPQNVYKYIKSISYYLIPAGSLVFCVEEGGFAGVTDPLAGVPRCKGVWVMVPLAGVPPCERAFFLIEARVRAPRPGVVAEAGGGFWGGFWGSFWGGFWDASSCCCSFCIFACMRRSSSDTDTHTHTHTHTHVVNVTPFKNAYLAYMEDMTLTEQTL